jgi:hypothetical protein
MNSPAPSIRTWAQRLLAAEDASPAATEARSTEVVRICEKLRVTLTQFVGADGFTALLRRALALARADTPSLKDARITSGGGLEGMDEIGGNAREDIDAAIALTAHLLDLLVAFIGEPLTVRLMRKAFPERSGPMIEESEDFK